MHFVVQDTIFRRRINAFIGTRDELLTHLRTQWNHNGKKEIGTDSLGQMFRFRYEFVNGVKTWVYYIWSAKFTDSVEDIGTLAHESFHVASLILEDLGVETSETGGSESIAYYFESIFTQTLTFARRTHAQTAS